MFLNYIVAMLKQRFNTPIGQLVVIVNNDQLIYCNWNKTECLPKLLKIEKEFIPASPTPQDFKLMKDAMMQLQEYFETKRTKFDLPIKPIGTHFELQVWEKLEEIKYGETVSYKTIARMIGNPGACRAVAAACGKNPLAIIIPCHRIVASNGKLGGYTGGLDIKTALINLETNFDTFQ